MNPAACTRLLSIVAIALLASCTAGGPRYKDLFVAFNRMGVPAKRMGQFPVFLADGKTGKPVPGASLIVDASPKPVVFKSDEAGQILIRIDSELLRTNPPFRIDQEGVELRMGFTMTLSGHAKSVRLHSVSGMKNFGDSRVAVFYKEEEEPLARKVHADLVRCRAGVRSVLGLEPVRMAVILDSARKEKDVLYLTVPAQGYDSTWVCFKDVWESGEFMRTTAHEWTESTIVSNLALYEDPRNRFIGDGLAEFGVWSIYGLPKDYRDRLSPAQMGDVKAVDLLSVFQVLPPSVLHWRRLDRGMKKHGYAPGYALSFAFWHELSERYGSNLISKFVKAMAGQKSPRAEEAIEILARITGDQRIGAKVRSLDVDAARSRIEQLLE